MASINKKAYKINRTRNFGAYRDKGFINDLLYKLNDYQDTCILKQKQLFGDGSKGDSDRFIRGDAMMSKRSIDKI